MPIHVDTWGVAHQRIVFRCYALRMRFPTINRMLNCMLSVVLQK